MDQKLTYKVVAMLYFVLTFILIGFAMVALVQGFIRQMDGNLVSAMLFYIAAPFLVMGSYLTFGKGYHKLRVLGISKP